MSTPPRRAPGGGSDPPPGGGVYRTAGAPHEPVVRGLCPYCGNECPPMVRICPHCDVRLDNVRCQRCFFIQAPGAFACVKCGQSLELEPLFDATDAPCPRCNHPLEVSPGLMNHEARAPEGRASDDARVHECPRCGGMFIPRDALAEILCAAEVGGALREASSQHGVPGLEEVRYLRCPQCHASMNRVNFGKVSGVIVDVCKTHGTWFDTGELTRVVAFAASGGLEKTRARERAEIGEERERRISAHVQLASVPPHDDPDTRLELWTEFLRAVLYW